MQPNTYMVSWSVRRGDICTYGAVALQDEQGGVARVKCVLALVDKERRRVGPKSREGEEREGSWCERAHVAGGDPDSRVEPWRSGDASL